MRLLQAPRHSPQVSSPRYVPFSSSIEPSAGDGPSRHDAHMLGVRAVPVDPYMAWLDQREADRRSSAAADPSRSADRFRPSQPTQHRAMSC